MRLTWGASDVTITLHTRVLNELNRRGNWDLDLLGHCVTGQGLSANVAKWLFSLWHFQRTQTKAREGRGHRTELTPGLPVSRCSQHVCVVGTPGPRDNPGRLVAEWGRLSTAVYGPSWTGEDLRREGGEGGVCPDPRSGGHGAPGLPTPGLVFSPPTSDPQNTSLRLDGGRGQSPFVLALDPGKRSMEMCFLCRVHVTEQEQTITFKCK